MRLLKNEKGYALVLVLLVTIFIMLVSTVFIRGSISNAKQERIVDENNLAYTAAEMGVDYYKWLYINKFKAERDGIWREKKLAYENDVINIKKKKISSTQEEEIKLVARNRQNEMIYALIENHFEELEKTKPDTIDSLNYQIQEPIMYKEVKNSDDSIIALIVEGTVKGKYGKEVARIKYLDFKLIFDFPLLALEGSSDLPNQDNGIEGIAIVNITKVIEMNIQTKKCSDKPVNEKCRGEDSTDSHFAALNSIIYFPNGFKKENGNMGMDFKNTQIYSEGNIELPNMNNMTNVTMYTDGNIEIKNLNSSNNANLYATGSIEFKNASSGYSNSTLYAENDIEAKNAKFKNMKIYVGDNYEGNDFSLSTSSYMIVGNELEIEKSGYISNSILIVKGNLDIEKSKSLEIKDGSKVCVGGNIDFDKINMAKIDSSSKIYFVKEKSEPKDIIGKYPNLVPIKESVFNKDPDALYKNCSGGGSGNENPNDSDIPLWEPPEIDVEYK